MSRTLPLGPCLGKWLVSVDGGAENDPRHAGLFGAATHHVCNSVVSEPFLHSRCIDRDYKKPSPHQTNMRTRLHGTFMLGLPFGTRQLDMVFSESYAMRVPTTCIQVSVLGICMGKRKCLDLAAHVCSNLNRQHARNGWPPRSVDENTNVQPPPPSLSPHSALTKYCLT